MKKGIKIVGIGMMVGLVGTIVVTVLTDEEIKGKIKDLVSDLRQESAKRSEEEEFKKAKFTGDSELNRKITEQQWEEVLQG